MSTPQRDGLRDDSSLPVLPPRDSEAPTPPLPRTTADSPLPVLPARGGTLSALDTATATLGRFMRQTSTLAQTVNAAVAGMTMTASESGRGEKQGRDIDNGATTTTRAATVDTTHATSRRALLKTLEQSVRALLNEHAGSVRPVLEGDVLLDHVCAAIERVFMHGYRGGGGGSGSGGTASAVATTVDKLTSVLAGQRREQPGPWHFIAASSSPHDTPTIQTIRDMSATNELRSDLARLRAWIRLSLMEQALARRVRELVDMRGNGGRLHEHYERWSLLRSPDASTLADVLTGLDALEINVTLRGDDLDAKPLPIPIMASDDEEGNDVHATEQSDDGKVVAIANSTASTVHAEQRQYLEERNRTLQTALSERTSALHTALARVRELERALEVQQEAATSTATSGTLSLALPFTTASYYSIPHAPSSTSNDANTTITALREEIARLTTAHATECALLRQRAEAERRAFSDARAETRRLLEKLEVMAGTCAQLRGSEGNAGHDDVEMEHLRLELADKELALRELGEAYAKLLRQQHMDEGK